MANKKLIIETEVKTDQIDSAAAKLGQLKDLGRGLSIQYDIDGKPIDVVIDKSKNLQQQFKLVTAELRRTKEGTAEFQLLAKTQGDLQDALGRTKAKSGDLLTSLQLLPGPVGEFSSKINGAIALLKTLTSFNLKDLRFQFKETAADIGEIIDNIFGLGKAATDTGKSIAEASDATTTLANTGSEKLNTAAIAENTKEQKLNAGAKLDDAKDTKVNSLAVDENTLANIENSIAVEEQNIAITKSNIAKMNAAIASGEVVAASKIEYEANFLNTSTKRLETLEEQKNTVAKRINTAEIETNTGAKVANTAATNGLTAALARLFAILTSGAAAFLGLLTIVGLVVKDIYRLATATTAAEEATKTFKETYKKNIQVTEEARNKILEVGVAFQQAKKGAIDKKVALETYNQILGGTIGKADTLAEAEKLYKNNTENYIKATGLRAEAQALFQIAAQKATEAITAQEKGFFSFDRGLFQSRGKANAIDRLFGRKGELEERVANLNEQAKIIRDRAGNILAQAGLAETGFKPKEDKKPTAGAKDDSAYQNLIKDLDAQIQLEINSDKTRRKVLQGLLDEKRKLIIEHDKLTYFQAQLLRQEDGKKLEAALEDDNKVIQENIKNREDLRVSAIDDEQQRELEARANKLYEDKLQKSKELKNEEEFLQAVADLEAVYARDILSIRDKFFQKKFKQEQEAYEREKQLRVQNREQELATDQQRIDDKTTFTEVFGDFFFGNKGLKGIYQKYFVDVRKAYQDEYDNDVVRYNQEEEALKANLGAKIITRETYEKEIIDLNNRRTASAQTNTQKQLELDKLEVDSKRASADMLVQIGTNLVGLISALDKKSKDMQIAAAIVEAGVSIARVIIDTQRAIIAFSASVAPLGPAGIPIAAGYAVKAKIAAGLSIATIVASGIGKLKEIKNSGDSGSGSAQGTSSTARGMEKGGMINGNRHSRGGVMINAEDGEAVMTRGAVSLFGPMLSMMNQAGGGASFNSNLLTTRQDKPLVSTPSVDDKPIIVKTYMVEKELTSYQNKQARLKDLSTL